MSNKIRVLDCKGYKLYLKQVYKEGCISVEQYYSVCVDIDVEPGVEEITFRKSHFCHYVELRNVMKQFPDVRTISIETGVSSINISNFMFPNVKHVYSKSASYLDGEEYLVKYPNILINTFCGDGEIQLGKYSSIGPYALEGWKGTMVPLDLCSAASIEIDADAVHGTEYMMIPREYGTAVCIGDHAVTVEADADVVTLPDNVTSINKNFSVKPGCTVSMKASTIRAFLEKLRRERMEDDKENSPVDLIIRILDKEDSAQTKFLLENHIHATNIRHISLIENPYFKSLDGIIYTSDMKKLVYCPPARTEKVVVPEGVEEIGYKAFESSTIPEVVFPDSLVWVDARAFFMCSELSFVDFNKVTEIGSYAFSYCPKLANVNLGSRMKTIQNNAFYGCDLLTEISLPATITKIGTGVCHTLNKVEFHGNKLPYGLFSGLCYSDLNGWNIFREDVIECITPDRHFFIPKTVSFSKVREMDYEVSNNRDTDSDSLDELLCCLYLNAYDTTAKYKCAIMEYSLHFETSIGKYLSRVASKIVDTFTDNESMLIEFIKCNVMNEKALKKALATVQEKGYASAEAYILSLLGQFTNVKSFRI